MKCNFRKTDWFHKVKLRQRLQGECSELLSFSFQNMTLISRCACIDGCGYPILPRGMSLGSFLLLLLLLAILLYLLVGYVYRRFVVGARGIELFPHLTFWREFPYLVQVRGYCLLSVFLYTRMCCGHWISCDCFPTKYRSGYFFLMKNSSLNKENGAGKSCWVLLSFTYKP